MSDSWQGGSHRRTTVLVHGWQLEPGKAPTISATGGQSVVISGTAANQPVIPYNQTEITVDADGV